MSAVSPVKQLLSTAPFNHLAPEVLAQIEEESNWFVTLGARLLTTNLRSQDYYCFRAVRILATLSNRSITLDRRGPGR